MATDVELAYMAGVVDSDGYIGLIRTRNKLADGTPTAYFSPRLNVQQVEPEAVDLFHATFGGRRAMKKSAAPGGKPLELWELTCQKARLATEALLPYLRIKRRRGEILIAAATIQATRPLETAPPVPADDRLLTLQEVAERTGRSYRAIRNAVADGRIPAVHGTHGFGTPRRFIAESLLPWSMPRGPGWRRSPEQVAELTALWAEMRALNRVGI